jgi:hypothetical protein
MPKYRVWVTQYCVPIVVEAQNKMIAEYEVRNNYTWEPAGVDVEVAEIPEENDDGIEEKDDGI